MKSTVSACVVSAFVRALTVVALIVFFLATFVRWVGLSGVELYDARDGFDGLGRQLLTAPGWYEVLSGSELWPGQKQCAHDACLIVGLLSAACFMRRARQTSNGRVLHGRPFARQIATHFATLLIALLIGRSSLWLLSGSARLYIPDSAEVYFRFVNHGKVPAPKSSSRSILIRNTEVMTPQGWEVRHALLKSVRAQVFSIASSSGSPVDLDAEKIVLGALDKDRPEDRAILLMSGIYNGGYLDEGQLPITWNQALELACHSPDAGGRFGDLTDVDMRRLHRVTVDEGGDRSTAGLIALEMLIGADQVIRVERNRRQSGNKMKDSLINSPEADDRAAAERRNTRIEEVRRQLSAETQLELDRFLTSPTSISERSQCLIRQELIHLTMQYRTPIVEDGDPELKHGLAEIADTLLRFLPYDRSTISTEPRILQYEHR